jgi:hypothetical protein
MQFALVTVDPTAILDLEKDLTLIDPTMK